LAYCLSWKLCRVGAQIFTAIVFHG
jgi:hypothetical protein